MENNTNKTLCVTSYNSGGLGLDRQHFIKTLLLFSDILCIQEHFLLDAGDRKASNTHKLINLFGQTHDMYIVPAYKDNTLVTRGRGKGGLVTMWSKCYTKYVTKVKSENFRVQATLFKFPDAALLIFNLYFMVDPQLGDFNETELLSVLAEISRIIHVTETRNILLLGDLNCDFSRNTRFVQTVRNFVEEKSCKVFWNHPDGNRISNIAYTYSNTVNNLTHSSIIDHFIGNERIFNAVTEANVICSPDNFSGHLPIYCKFNVNDLNLQVEPNQSKIKPSWNKASEEDRQLFKNSLNNDLNDIMAPNTCFDCNRLNCNLHSEDIESFVMDICEAVDTAAHECLPMVGGAQQNPRGVPGWNEFVKPYRDESLFWDGLWKAAGSPPDGELFVNSRQSKMQYKYAVRRLKRTRNTLLQDKFIDTLLDGGTNIFKEIKKFRGQNRVISSCIDGEVGAQNIANHFSGIYSELYSRHSLDENFLDIINLVDINVNEELGLYLDRINFDSVKCALAKLKSNKSDAMYDFTSDCLLNAPDSLIHRMTDAFKWFLRTGKVPDFLLYCTLVPIVKDGLGDIASSDNYRAIAIGSLILKWFDWLILILESDKLSTDELQFGFQAKSSTTMCTWAISTVVDHYNRAGRPVFACTMDLTKAFDLVAWNKLFNELYDRGISPLVIRCLIYIYSMQNCDVRWSSEYSKKFNVTNGVRQGAVSSPILFCIYINKLITKIKYHGIGCQINNVFLGIWIYADDIVLLAPSRQGLQAMVTLCENFANEMKLTFSTNAIIDKCKTKCIVFSNSIVNRDDYSPIMLNNLPLPYVNSVNHLGTILEQNNSMFKDCNVKRAKFISKIHSLNQEFHFAHPNTVIRLYNIYACSFYGSNLWDLYSDNVNRIYSSWNVATKVLFKLPYGTHRYFIEPLTETVHVKPMLCSRFVSFFESLTKCNKLPIRLLANLCKNDKRTVLGKNLDNIAKDCGVDNKILTKAFVKQNLKFCRTEQENIWKVNMLKELIDVRRTVNQIDNLDGHQIDDIITFLCTD